MSDNETVDNKIQNLKNENKYMIQETIKEYSKELDIKLSEKFYTLRSTFNQDLSKLCEDFRCFKKIVDSELESMKERQGNIEKEFRS